ncbi:MULTISPECIES: sugar transferase [Mucilaginibacter]|jgi:lipopolysaccharide/colanic/teichoic acid biosynthesis glycosyltransferase|uniref:sugar transferase n=1 Tax=Mucilaginibacter TaxID=423349 RepID=UPI000871A6D2|nr:MULTISPECIES: sugar transferase [Mucilaginibacter]NVM65642.1 lipopolysaccharide/colanic/teichoic acid biosynthesis glycosyltransferase [Mucilaginibacter sp. SG538B]GGB01628.1 glycosyl transferase [Mucilaginibacter rubeus]SCW56066.1 Sugar transferase involved in LPS biosynthesis (colanic, teichoic acid) [Mucilaginibacter sp. NFR10]
MIKRLFDIVISLIALIMLLPLFILIAIAIKINSRGSAFYKQTRVGKDGNEFELFKFRTMYINSDRAGLLTIGSKDYRITSVGYWLRKYKLDELPQLLNVLKGDMSFVGPRPEVRKYVNLYTPAQLRVLSVKPGVTDWASIKYFDENDILAGSDDPEDMYIKVIVPSKISKNLEYIDNQDLFMDLKIILSTIKRIFQ